MCHRRHLTYRYGYIYTSSSSLYLECNSFTFRMNILYEPASQTKSVWRLLILLNNSINRREEEEKRKSFYNIRKTVAFLHTSSNNKKMATTYRKWVKKNYRKFSWHFLSKGRYATKCRIKSLKYAWNLYDQKITQRNFTDHKYFFFGLQKKYCLIVAQASELADNPIYI